MSLRDLLSNNIHRFMARDGIANVSALAKKSGVPQPTLSLFLTGKHQSLALRHIEQLARCFSTDPARLFDINLDHLPDRKISGVLAAMEQMDESQKNVVMATSIAVLESTQKNHG